MQMVPTAHPAPTVNHGSLIALRGSVHSDGGVRVRRVTSTCDGTVDAITDAAGSLLAQAKTWIEKACPIPNSRRAMWHLRCTSRPAACIGSSRRTATQSEHGCGSGVSNAAAATSAIPHSMRCRSATWERGGACGMPRTSAARSRAGTAFRPRSTGRRSPGVGVGPRPSDTRHSAIDSRHGFSQGGAPGQDRPDCVGEHGRGTAPERPEHGQRTETVSEGTKGSAHRRRLHGTRAQPRVCAGAHRR